jgi:hypothetical protein
LIDSAKRTPYLLGNKSLNIFLGIVANLLLLPSCFMLDFVLILALCSSESQGSLRDCQATADFIT